MKRNTLGLIAALLIGAPVIVGCERTITEERSVEQKRDGTTVIEKEKVTETPNGGIKKTEEKEVVR